MKINRWFGCALVMLGLMASVAAVPEAGTEGVPEGAIEKLSSEKYDVRVEGYLLLDQWSKKNVKSAPELLYNEWARSDDPEVKARCYTLLKAVTIFREFGPGQGFVGIMMDPMVVRPGGRGQQQAQIGISIVSVVADTPAEKAGLLAGDSILAIDDLDFNDLPEKQKQVDVRLLFQIYVKSKNAGDKVTLHLLRAGKKIKLELTLGKRPDWLDQQSPFGNRGLTKKSKEEAFFNQWMKKMSESE